MSASHATEGVGFYLLQHEDAVMQALALMVQQDATAAAAAMAERGLDPLILPQIIIMICASSGIEKAEFHTDECEPHERRPMAYLAAALAGERVAAVQILQEIVDAMQHSGDPDEAIALLDASAHLYARIALAKMSGAIASHHVKELMRASGDLL